ncbi:hypothetical protein ACUXST_002244, partial [Sphingomonas sp. F9_3S_D5_B_2]
MTTLSLFAAATVLAGLSASTSAQPHGQNIAAPPPRHTPPPPFVAPAPIREIVDRQL